MRDDARRNIRRFLLWSAVAAAALTPLLVSGQDLDGERRDYVAAVRAIDIGQWQEYKRLRRGLDDYPLAIYLDYFRLKRQADTVSLSEAQDFLARSADTPLANRLLALYLRRAGMERRWQDFLQVMPWEPNSTDLKCYYFRAQLAQGNKSIAWAGATSLWVAGKSQPTECDPLFEAFQSAGELTDDVIWTRLLNAFAERQRSLLTYVAKRSSAQLRRSVDKLLAVYRNPASIAQQSLSPDDPHSADIASAGLINLASYSPEDALAYWTVMQQQLHFSPEQTRRIEYAIARQSLFAGTAANNAWLAGALARLQDDELVGIRLRWALAEQDWGALENSLPLLSAQAMEKNVWRYWQAVLQEQRGDAELARIALEQLAEERDYYGFLAADKLGSSYSFNHARLKMKAESPVTELAALRRIEELIYHDQEMLAHSEWYKVLQDTEEAGQQRDLMLLASHKGWHRMAIDAAARAEEWDALDQRFPTPYQEIFQRHAALREVPLTELMSIARRESAFYPGAQSPVGARGLMQIMPATGKEVAASLQQRHTPSSLFDVEHNVLLGSAYYRQLLDRFDGNRVFALTAYNAGPHRVKRWRHKAGEGVPVEVWIETIPYRETRDYVQAVLAYNVVFQYLLGDTQRLLTTVEQQANY